MHAPLDILVPSGDWNSFFSEDKQKSKENLFCAPHALLVPIIESTHTATGLSIRKMKMEYTMENFIHDVCKGHWAVTEDVCSRSGLFNIFGIFFSHPFSHCSRFIILCFFSTFTDYRVVKKD
jgi:hypothetical protein